MYRPMPSKLTKCLLYVCSMWTPECLLVSLQESDVCAWVKTWEVFISTIIYRFPSSYSLFAWLTLDTLIAPHRLFLVFWKVGRTPRERLWEHMVENCRQTHCRSQRTMLTQAKSTGPFHPTFVVSYVELCFPQREDSALCKAHEIWGAVMSTALKYSQWEQRPSFKHVSDSLCHFLFREGCVCRTRHTNNTVEARGSVCASVREYWVKGCVSVSVTLEITFPWLGLWLKRWLHTVTVCSVLCSHTKYSREVTDDTL